MKIDSSPSTFVSCVGVSVNVPVAGLLALFPTTLMVKELTAVKSSGLVVSLL